MTRHRLISGESALMSDGLAHRVSWGVGNEVSMHCTRDETLFHPRFVSKTKLRDVVTCLGCAVFK